MNHTDGIKATGLPLLVFCSLCLIWGSTWLAIKIGLDYFSPFIFAGIRFLVGGFILVVPLLLLRKRYPHDMATWVFMLRLGVFQIVIPYALVFWGEQYTSSGLAAILFATVPLFVTVIAHYAIPGEQWSRNKFLGIGISLAGLVLIFIRDISSEPQSVWGALAVVGAALCAAIANVMAKHAGSRVNPLINVSVQLSLGGIVLTLLSLAVEPQIRISGAFAGIAALLYLSIFGSVLGFVGLYWLFTKMEVTKVSLMTLITPVVAVVCGTVFLSEKLAPNMLGGTLLILAGMYLVTKH